MNLRQRIENLAWVSGGEAKRIYEEFILEPDYSREGDGLAPAERLMICLMHDGEYQRVATLAQDMQDAWGEEAPLAYLFGGLAADMLADHETAVRFYRRFLACKVEETISFSYLEIDNCGEAFINCLIEHAYSRQGAKDFFTRVHLRPFERKLQDQLLMHRTPHFHIYFYPASSAEKEIERIAEQRELAYQRISDYLGLHIDLTVKLYLFENAEMKLQETKSHGMGWAFRGVMVEIFNEQVRLNPFHELVHVLADYAFGETVAAFSEGLAVYLSVLFAEGPSAEPLNEPYKDKIIAYHEQGALFQLRDLLSFEFGSDVSKPLISYPQAASFMEYCLQRLTFQEYIDLYSLLWPDYSRAGWAMNLAHIEQAFGDDIDSIEQRWLAYALK